MSPEVLTKEEQNYNSQVQQLKQSRWEKGFSVDDSKTLKTTFILTLTALPKFLLFIPLETPEILKGFSAPFWHSRWETPASKALSGMENLRFVWRAPCNINNDAFLKPISQMLGCYFKSTMIWDLLSLNNLLAILI